MNVDQIEIHVGDPGFEYDPIRELEVKSEARSAFSKSPNEDDVNMQLRRLAASVGGDAVVNVQYNRGVSMSSWNSLKATGLAVRKVSTDIPCPVCAETVKRAAKKCRFCGADLTSSAVGAGVGAAAAHGDPELIRLASPGSMRPRNPKPHQYPHEPLKSTDNNSRTFLIVFAVIVAVLMLIGVLSE